MSKTFFTALGRQFMRKQASRLPWPVVLQALRKKDLLPGIVPRLPFLEPDEEPTELPELESEPEPEIIPVPIAIPVANVEPAPELPPKRKSEGETVS